MNKYNTERITFTPSNTAEDLLSTLPKKCSCQLCQESRDYVKKELGEKKFKQICNLIGIIY